MRGCDAGIASIPITLTDASMTKGNDSGVMDVHRAHQPEQLKRKERRAAEQQNVPEHWKIFSIISSYLSRGKGSLLARIGDAVGG
jgi:hypothetical protein